MNSCDIDLQEIISRLNQCDVVEGASRVATTCMFPDGGIINVYVYRSKDSKFIVTDDSAAVQFLLSNGFSSPRALTKTANKLAEKFFLSFKADTRAFYSEPIDKDQVESVIIYMANLIQNFTFNQHEKIYEEQKARLNDEIVHLIKSNKSIPKHSIKPGYTIAGDSNKQFHFDCGIIVSGKRILVDGINNHPLSIASAYMKFNDTKDCEDVFGEAVIDKTEEWSSTDIRLVRSSVENISDINERLKPMFKRFGFEQI